MSKLRWQCVIMDLTEKARESVRWLRLAQDRDQRPAVTTVMNFPFAEKRGLSC